MVIHGMSMDGMARDSITMNGRTTVTNEMHAIAVAHAHVAILGANVIVAAIMDSGTQWMSTVIVAPFKYHRFAPPFGKVENHQKIDDPIIF